MKLKLGIASLGVALLILNAYGLTQSLRNSAIYVTFREPDNHIQVRYEDALRRMSRRGGEDDLSYAIRVNRLVHLSTVHYWNEENGSDQFNLRVPPWENYLLFAASFVIPQVFERYEFEDYGRALERGVGLCSERAIILHGILSANGVPAEITGLGGHVVVRAQVAEGNWRVLDPDYDVVIPYDILEIQDNPELVRPFYSEQEADSMVEIYGRDGNVIGLPSYSVTTSVLMYVEWLSYIGIWLIPVALLVPLTWRVLLSVHRRVTKSTSPEGAQGEANGDLPRRLSPAPPLGPHSAMDRPERTGRDAAGSPPPAA